VAFQKLAKKVIGWAMQNQKQEKKINPEVIRNYNEPRNEVHDKASGLKMPYTEIVVAGNLGKMIEARRVSTK